MSGNPGPTDNIHVAIRARPLNERETSTGQTPAWAVQSNTLYMPHPSDQRPIPGTTFAFDKVFDEKSLNSHVYDGIARDIVMSTLDGVNGTIFAYGQTSSGKTFTMMGSGRHAGIIPMAIRDVFLYISQTPDREFLLRVSYLEIYNEVIKDLLAPENDNLKIHENPNREIFVGGLTEEIVLAPEEVMRLMSKGEANRHTGETNMNERSSRSHTIFRMVIESRERRTEGEGASRSSYSGAVKVSSLSLVDLAGSERVGHTGAEGIRLKEGGHINKSLLTLGTVIGKLSEGSDKVHIPYRDSKLTRILQPSLGGNARTAIICTITMAQAFAEETVSTLKFASRAKTIRNRPEVNEVISDEALLKRYKKEIDSLKAQLDELKSKDPKDTDKISKTRSIEEQQMLQTKFEELRMMILNSSRAGEAQTAPARKARALRRQTWFPGVNPHFSDEESEDDAKGQSGIAETDRTESPAPGETHAGSTSLRSLDTESAPSTAKASTQFQIEILRSQLSKTSMELSALKEAEAKLRTELDSILSACDGIVSGDVFASPPDYPDAARRLQETIRQLVVAKEALESAVSRSDERDRFLQLENEMLSKVSNELEERNTEMHKVVTELQQGLAKASSRCEEVDRERQEALERSLRVQEAAAESEELMKARMSDLSDKLGAAEELLERSRSEIRALAAAHDQLATAVEAEKLGATQMIAALKDEFAVERTAMAAKAAERDGLIETAKADLLQVQQAFAAAQAELLETRATYEAAVASLREEVVQLQTQADSLQAGDQTHRSELESVRDQNNILGRQLSEANESLNTLKDELARAESCIHDWDAERSQLAGENLEMKQRLEELAMVAAASDEKVRVLVAENEQLKATASERDSKADDLVLAITELQSTISAQAGTIASLSTDLENARTALAKRQSQLDDQAAECNTLQCQVKELAERDGEQVELLQQMQGVIEKLQQEKGALEHISRDLEASAEKLKEELDSALREIDNRDRRIAQLEESARDIHPSISEIESLRGEVLRLQSERDWAKSSLNRLEGELAIGREKVQGASEREMALATRIAEVEGQILLLRKENEELVEVNDSATHDLVALELEMTATRDAAATQASAFSDAKRQMEERIADLESQLSAAERSVDDIMSKISTDKEDHERLQSLNDSLQEELSAARDEMDRLASSLQQHLDKSGKYEAELAMMQAEGSSSSSRIAMLENELASTRAQVSSMTAENLALNGQLAELREALNGEREVQKQLAEEWEAKDLRQQSLAQEHKSVLQTLANREAVCLDLEAKLENLDQQLQDAKREAQLRADYHAKLKDQLTAAQAAISDYAELQDRESELQDKVATLNDAVESLSRETRQLREANSQANTVVTLQEQKIRAMSERVELLSQELRVEAEKGQHADEERHIGLQKLERMRVSIQDLEKEREALQSARSLLEEELEGMAKAMDELQVARSESAARIDVLEQRLAESMQRAHVLQDGQRQLREELAVREADVFEKSRIIDRLQQHHADGSSADPSVAADQGKWHKMYLDMQRQGRDEADRLRSELEKIRTHTDREQQRLKQKLAQLEDELAASEATRLQEQQTLAQTKQIVANLQGELAKSRAALASDTTTLGRATPRNQAFDDTQQNMAIRLEFAEKEIAQLSAENEKLRTQLRTSSLVNESARSDHLAELIRLKEVNQRLQDQARQDQTSKGALSSALAPKIGQSQPSDRVAQPQPAPRHERSVKVAKENDASGHAALQNASKVSALRSVCRFISFRSFCEARCTAAPTGPALRNRVRRRSRADRLRAM